MFVLDDGKALRGFLKGWIFNYKIEDHSYWKDYFFKLGIDDPEYLKSHMRKDMYDENMATTYHSQVRNLENYISFDHFKEKYLEQVVHDLLNKMNFKMPEQLAWQFWHQNYKEGSYHSPHDHGGSLLSGIYLLELENDNTTVFYSRDKERKEQIILDDVKEGDLILFDSKIWHSVDPCDGKKISICFNVEKG